jgi:hypothetical protein
MRLLVLAMLISGAFANAEILLSTEKNIDLGYIGSVEDAQSIFDKGKFEFVLDTVENKRRRYNLNFKVTVKEAICVRPHAQCGGMEDWDWRYSRVPYDYVFINGRVIPVYRVFHPAYGQSTCVCTQYEDKLVEKDLRLRLKFKKAVYKTEWTDSPRVYLQFKASENSSLDFEVLESSSLSVKRKGLSRLVLTI